MFLPFRSAMLCTGESLRTQNAIWKPNRVRRGADVGLGVAFPHVLALLRLGRLADVEQQEVGLLRVDRVDDAGVAAVADDAHLQLGMVLHHLRDHRGLRVQQRARLQRGEADGLLGCATVAQTATRPDDATPSFSMSVLLP